MYRVALSIVKNPDDAQDITQEAVTKLWEIRKTLPTVDNPQAYCATIARRLSIDHIRASHNRTPINELYTMTSDDDIPQQYDRKESLSLAIKMMERLPANQQRVLKLRSFSGCSIEEIAEITGFTSVNVRALLSRARRGLKHFFSQND